MANDSGPHTYPLYPYAPSLAAAVIFCILFIFATLIHTYQMFIKKTWFLIPLIIGGYCELIGYACRAASARQPRGQYTLMPFVIQNSYILLAPALFAATVYMILGRIIKLTDGDKHSIVSSRRLTWFFLAGDIFCFALQGGGGSLVAIAMKDPQSSKAKLGSNIVLAGIVLQALWFVLFVVGATCFQYRMRSCPTNRVQTCPDIYWQRYLGSLYLVSALVIVRSIFRLAEYAQGTGGYAQSTEVLFYMFDSLPMFAFMVWMSWQHPSEIALLLRKYGYGDGDHVESGGLRVLHR